MVMTIGEFEYDSIFGHNNDSRNLLTSFPTLGYILWIIFLVVMPILVTNLLVRQWVNWKKNLSSLLVF